MVLARLLGVPQIAVAFCISCLCAALAFLALTVVYYIWHPILSQDAYVVIANLCYCLIVEFTRHQCARKYGRLRRNFYAFLANSVNYPLQLLYVSLANGLGFGITLTLISYGQIILDSAGEAALYFRDTCHDGPSAYFHYAVTALLLNIFHTCASILTFYFTNDARHASWRRAFLLNAITHAFMLFFVRDQLTVMNHTYCGANLILGTVFVVLHGSLVLSLVRSPEYPAMRVKSRTSIIPDGIELSDMDSSSLSRRD